ncbi:MAG: vitamin B12 dependent-methionine synthase activation domain-containing protein [Anaerolineae bacterium]
MAESESLPHIVEPVDFHFDTSALIEQLRIQGDASQIEELTALVEQAALVARPKAMYRLVFVNEAGDDYVTLDAVRFTSRVLRVNIAETHRAFACLATCGVELEQWAEQLDDPLYTYWSENIRLHALGAASKALLDDLNRRYQPGQMSHMNPGSLSDWPLGEQRPMFRLLGDTRAAIGVQLQPSLLMWPTKTVSSVAFPTSSTFESCQLCPRQACPNRRAPFDPGMMDREYKGKPKV